MKAAIQKIPISADQAFVIRELRDPYFDPNWHFHPEYQLFLVLKGSGTRFIGDSIAHFEEGEVLFTGPNLPHLWRSDDLYFQEDSPGTHGLVIYFGEHFLGEAFLEKQEMHALRQLFHQAHRGVEVVGATRTYLTAAMQRMLTLEGFDRVLALLQALHVLATSSEWRPVASLGYSHAYNPTDADRMNRVHTYVMDHFKGEVRLSEAAALASMSDSAFCRYFKAHANKTFSAFVSEIRIGYACKLLAQEHLSITQIAYECGFPTLSNFNRQFKRVTQETPFHYRKQFLNPHY
ncbi:AraC-type DNA-binding protein [Catalinimonas alkaloidigena]|uniref:AraC-type DNA-binding protein n=1 Tax=Catalinimonas alkaloidigena TaxID=1075417 RepID=A0A1G9TKN8_9BACT|nr:AraC family transcriptional regulator [Catalinimonas alkaloidigena]SDM48379.1 AraC-type DNA-binding protein [Catalinimonas alkaloidigena]